MSLPAIRVLCRQLLSCGHLPASKQARFPGGLGQLFAFSTKNTVTGTDPPGKAPKKHLDEFERHVLGEADLDESELEVHEELEDVAERDDFLQELEKIEQETKKAEKLKAGKKPEAVDVKQKLQEVEKEKEAWSSEGADIISQEFLTKAQMKDESFDPENDESLLNDDEAIFWNDELETFVTPKGYLSIPGMGDRSAENPEPFRPDRTYYPGHTYRPEDFDLTRPTSNAVEESPFKGRKAHATVWAAADFRNIKFLSEFVTETSKIKPRRVTGVRAKAQRKIVREIKTARALGLIPFTSMGDPPYRYLKNKPAREEYSDEEDTGRRQGFVDNTSRYPQRRY